LSFIDFLASAEQGVWQMLPVGPAGYGDSPYSAQSAFAGNPLLIAVDDGEENTAPATQRGGARAPSDAIDYARTSREREPKLRAAAANVPRARITTFAEEVADWLRDFTLYRALKRAHHHVQWTR